MAEKIEIVTGMFTYGFIWQVTESIRHSILIFVFIFGLGIILLFRSLRFVNENNL